jgi:hypothetical protein
MQPDHPNEDKPTVTFHKVYPAAISPMRADKAALGTLPTMAYRHCEPVRMASAFGWYIFPPEDIYLKYNGSDTFQLVEDEWLPLLPSQLPGLEAYWDEHAPPDMKGLAPPYISPLPVKGFVQIWSGLLCATRPGWSMLIRPPVNMRGSHMFSCFEGLIEADQFQPFPLFINIQLLATDALIRIQKEVPLFQVQPLMRGTYGTTAHQFSEREGLALADDGLPAMSAHDWAGYRKTIRLEDTSAAVFEMGQYTGATRKRTKHDSESE